MSTTLCHWAEPASIQCGLKLFDRGERGHPANITRSRGTSRLGGPRQS